MCQHQLLLLVLATVIVGLATVAGIQAFDQGQQQAAQDALVQGGTTFGQDILAVHQKPNQLGGAKLSGDATTIAERAGYSGATIDVPGAGNNAKCKLTVSGSSGSGTGTINCGLDGFDGGDVTITVNVDPSADPKVDLGSVNISS